MSEVDVDGVKVARASAAHRDPRQHWSRTQVVSERCLTHHSTSTV